MGIRVEWFAEDRPTLLYTVEGNWTWDDFHGAMTTAYSLMDAAPFVQVDSIVDMQQGQTLPSNILSRMQGISQSRHAKSRDMVVVGAGYFPQKMFDIMEKLAPQGMRRVTLVKTLDEALQLLEDKYGSV
jgi:hypothetical protein